MLEQSPELAPHALGCTEGRRECGEGPRVGVPGGRQPDIPQATSGGVAIPPLLPVPPPQVAPELGVTALSPL